MNIEKVKERIKEKDYDFIKNDEHLGNNIILLTVGGSIAYGTDIETSDIDIRGIAVNSKEEILLGTDFEQFEDRQTDSVIYSFNKIIDLLTKCNPNTIEMLGNREDFYLKVSDIGRLLLDNKSLFISKQCMHSFGGYATAQLRRLENKSARVVAQAEREKHILETIENARYVFDERYNMPNINLYVDKSDKKDFDSELFVDINLKHYPLRDMHEFLGEITSIVRSYDKTGMRNSKAIEHNKLGKHMMHLLRLYMMCIDMLEKGEINTYREEEHDLLMQIRNGEYLDSNKQPKSEFYDILDEYTKRFEYAKLYTSLPDKPDYKGILELKSYINEKIVKGEI